MAERFKFEETAVTVITRTGADEAEESAPPCLVVYAGGDVARRLFLEKTLQVIGRSDSADITIDHESVSRQHARLLTHNGVTSIHDMGSTNGTFINDKEIQEVTLEDGDLLRVGPTTFKYLSGSNLEAKYHEEIHRLATIDGLTGCSNKRHFMDTLSSELARSQRYSRLLALIIFDLDHFKKVNDKFGHLAGDLVLRDLPTIVREHLRAEDTFARYGGEEFAIVLPEVDLEGALNVAEKIRCLIEKHKFIYQKKRLPVTISLGIHVLDAGESTVSAEQFIEAADGKLYEAKEGGRNRVAT
ncbi:GGDEF domain-containing protein [Myxococcota bacterium]|nr:GGDEF domain-containing protein [Myxococcota bacterium]